MGSCERALTETCRTVHGVIMLIFLYVETTAIFKLEKQPITYPSAFKEVITKCSVFACLRAVERQKIHCYGSVTRNMQKSINKFDEHNLIGLCNLYYYFIMLSLTGTIDAV